MVLTEGDGFAEQRNSLVDRLVREGVLESEDCIRAMREVPRHLFVPEGQRRHAYDDNPIPLGETGQTVSAPHMCGYLLEALELEVGHTVFEVGAGSGYQSALVAEVIAPSAAKREEWGNLTTIEIVKELYRMAKANLKAAEYDDRVTVVQGDGSLGWPPAEEREIYDRILVTAGAPRVPETLRAQLKSPGVLAIPVGSRYFQRLEKVTKSADGELESERLVQCAFVPLVGKRGWAE